MKRVKKILILNYIIFIIFCLNTKVYSYTLDEVKERTEFKTVEEDGEPSEYDFLIDAQDLINNEKLPYIEYTVDDVIYTNEDIFDIDFLNKDTKNENKYWLNFSKVITVVFSISFYTSIAIMLTLLIYMGIVVVSSSITAKAEGVPLWEIFNSRVRNPLRNVKRKVFLEQWILSLFFLVSIVFLISLMASVSNYITRQFAENKIGNEDKEKITIYVKGSKEVDEESSGSTTQTPVTNSSGKYMFIGDSRTVGMQDAIGNSNDIFKGEIGEGYDWMVNTAFPDVEDYVESGMTIIIWLGVNDPDNASKYVNAINDKASEWISKGATVCFASPGPVVDSKSQYVKNSQIEKFNETLKSGLSSNIKYIDVYTELTNNGFEDQGDGVHYNAETYKKVYNYLKSGAGVSGNNSSNGVITKDIDYYFKTNLEGFFMFQSQHSWKKASFVGINFFYMGCGYLLFVFKIFIFAIYVVRLVALGLLTVIAPVAIIINAYQRVLGNKGFLKKWFMVYVATAFIKTVIDMAYYVLIKANTKTIAQNPYYEILVVILMFIVIFMYLGWIRRIVRGRRNAG